jgi:hypothetical protein
LNFSDELIGRNGVSECAAIAGNVGAGEPHFFAVMVFADHHRVVKSADGGDLCAMLFEGL